MTVEGHIENGQIVLDGPLSLPEGVKVRVELVNNDLPETALQKDSTAELPTLYERLKPLVGCVKDLPADFAINHDHYLHGQPKRRPLPQ